MSRIYAVSGREFTLNDMRIAKGDKGDKGDRGDRGDKGDKGDKWGDELITLVDDATNAANTAAYNANTTNTIAIDLVDNLTNQTIDFVNDAINNTVISSGFVTIDSFELGTTITQRNQALRHAADGKLYRWAGYLPKVVPVGSTPTSSGGMGDNAWLEVSDVTLRQEIGVAGGVVKIKHAQVSFAVLSDLVAADWLKIGMVVSTKGYYTVGDGGGNDYKIVPAGTGTDDGGSFIDLVGSNTQARGLFAGVVNVKQFGAKGDGVTDDTDSVKGAIATAGMGGTVVFLGGQKSFLISSELVMLQGQQWIFEGGQRASKLLKGYNGNVIKTSSLGRLISPFVDGNGATYTGTNIVIPSGTFSPYMENVRTVSSEGAGILFEKNAGGGNRINGIEGDTTSPETVGVISLTEDTSAVPRFWNDVYLSGGVLDLTGGGNGLAVSNFYIRNIITGYTGSTISGLFKMSNGRFAGLGVSSTITAADALFSTTSFAVNLTLDNCQGVKFSPTCILGSITENNDNSRFNVWYKAGLIYNTIWTASDGSLGDIGDGTLKMTYSREGESCKIQLELTYGSTTTPPSGSGQWRFTLPFKGNMSMNQRGILVNIYDSSTPSDTFALGSVGADEDFVGFGVDGQGIRNGYPFDWGSGDQIIANFEYLVR